MTVHAAKIERFPLNRATAALDWFGPTGRSRQQVHLDMSREPLTDRPDDDGSPAVDCDREYAFDGYRTGERVVGPA